MMRLAGDGSKEPGCASTDYGNVSCVHFEVSCKLLASSCEQIRLMAYSLKLN